MNNCLILGFGRSGTSLLGGLLFHSGYFLGNHLHPARHSNLEGFYEDIIINRINEQILEPYDYSKHFDSYPVFSKEFSPYNPRRGHRWLVWIKPGTSICCNEHSVRSQIQSATNQQQAFAYKDPRFNYTLPVWLEFLPENTCFLCIFRNPASVVQSVIKECNAVEYLQNFYMDQELCYQIWYNSYRHLLDTLTAEINSRTLFVSYEGLIRGKYLESISMMLGTDIQKDFIKPFLNRNIPSDSMPANVSTLYAELNKLAGIT